MFSSTKTLVLADIHSNWNALSAIEESFDQCLILGDIVEYGVDPLPCLKWCKERGTLTIRGNHDHAVSQFVTPNPGSVLRQLAGATRGLHWNMLGTDHISWLNELPLSAYHIVDGRRLFLVHASPKDPLDGVVPSTAEAWRPLVANIDAEIILVGHTHVPFQLEVDGKLVINPGSVGMPRDGDPRASYCVIEGDEIRFERVEYDIEGELAKYEQYEMEPSILEIARNTLTNGGYVATNETTVEASTP